jgi:hypothetical protein
MENFHAPFLGKILISHRKTGFFKKFVNLHLY